MSFIEYSDVVQYNIGSKTTVWISLVGVVVGSVLTRATYLWDKRRAVTKVGDLYNFYLTSAVPDIIDQIEEIKKYTEEIKNYKESDVLIDSSFLFDYTNKLDFPLLQEYFKRTDKKHAIEKAAEVFGCLNIGKSELSKLSKIIAEYETIALSYDEQFYDLLIQFQRDVKVFEDTTWKTINAEDQKKLENLHGIIDKHLDDDCDYDLATYITFDKTFINELMKHPYYLDQSHMLYSVILNFTDDWHKIKIKAQNKQTLHLDRIDIIIASLQAIYETLSSSKYPVHAGL